MGSDLRICHISTVHHRHDVRIFHKECLSLAVHYSVFFVVADGHGDEFTNGVQIIDAGKRAKNIPARFVATSLKAYRKALALRCHVYHFHDPELIWIGYLLHLKGKKVIYDVHEDLPRQLLRKTHVRNFLKPLLSKTVELTERILSRRFNAVITSTPNIAARFSSYNKNVTAVCNFVRTGEFPDLISYSSRQRNIAYIGGLTSARGLREVLAAVEMLGDEVRLNIAGRFDNWDFERRMLAQKGWRKVLFHGYAGRDEVARILADSRVGLLTLHPDPSYMVALPVKLFEYMAAGIPVVASGFPAWKEIIEKNNCGLCVNPLDPEAIAGALRSLLENPGLAENMGINGKKAVDDRYNWKHEEEKLLEIYKRL